MALQPGNRKDSSFRAISTVPSINKTPGPGTPPLPYPVTNDLSGSQGTVSSVRINGSPAFVMDQSKVPSVMGDQPGSIGGVKSNTVGGKVEPTKGSDSVRVGGKWLVRPFDPCTLNSGNTIGLFVMAPLPPVIAPGQHIQQPSRPAKEKTDSETSFLQQRKAAGLDKSEPGTRIQGLGKVPDLSKPAALSGAAMAVAAGVSTPPGTKTPTPTAPPLSMPAPEDHALAATPNTGPEGNSTPNWSEKEIKEEWAKTEEGKKVMKELPPDTKFAGFDKKPGASANASYDPETNTINIPNQYTSKEAAPTAAHEATHAHQSITQGRPDGQADLLNMEVEAKKTGLTVYEEMGRPKLPYNYEAEANFFKKDPVGYENKVREVYAKLYKIPPTN